MCEELLAMQRIRRDFNESRAVKIGAPFDPVSYREYYIPIVYDIIRASRAMGRCHITGVIGGPGAGKTTLARIFDYIIQIGFGLKSLTVSSDDFYLASPVRRELGHVRRSPNTLDLDSAQRLFAGLLENQREVIVPRYNTNEDKPQTSENVACPVDICIFEGWLVGKLLSDTFGACKSVLNTLVFLEVDAVAAKQARFKREYEVRIQTEGRYGLSPTEVESFWEDIIVPGIELFVTPYKQDADVILCLDLDHRPSGITQP